MAKPEELLKKHDLFESLDESFVKSFIEKAEERMYEEGDILYVEHSEGDEIFFILEGETRVGVELVSGADAAKNLIPVNEGDFIGLEMAIKSGPRSVTVTATKPTKVWVWKTTDWQGLCESEPKQGYQLLLRVAQALHQRMHIWTENVLNNVSWGIE